MPVTYNAIRGQLNTTEYYLVNMPFGEIARLTELPQERNGEYLLSGLDDMQREINWRRVKGEMRDYLINNPDAFFSSLALFIVPQDLSPIEEGRHYVFRPEGEGEEWGRLTLPGGNTFFFPGDGQHRAAAIREAVRMNPRMASEKVPAVLIPFKRKDQVRQLFADLNLNAKPVSKTVGLGFETRDPLAILTKRVAMDVRLFQGRVNMKSTSLPSSYPQVITMSALYESNRHLIAALLEAGRDGSKVTREITPDNVKDQLADLKSLDPTDDVVGDAAESLVEVWETIIAALPGWSELLENTKTAGEIREEYVHAHGLGWQATAHAVAVVIRAYRNDEDWLDMVTTMIQSVDWQRQSERTSGNPDLQGIAVLGSRVNNTRESVRATAGYILHQGGILAEADGAASYLAAYENLRRSYQEADRAKAAMTQLSVKLADVDLDPSNHLSS
jgi:DNA sulfur modification protein DndB